MKKLKIKSLFSILVKRKKITIPIALVFLILLIVFRPKTQAPDLVTVGKNYIAQAVSVNGLIIAKKSVDLTFSTSGKLVYLGVAKGDSVEAGQVIANLDLRTVEKNIEEELKDYAKQRNTFEQTQDDNQDRRPEQALNDKMKRILEDNQYDLERAVLSVELKNLAREQSILISPIAGIVSRADSKNSGINVTTSATFTVVDPTSLAFHIDVDEADISKVTIGNKVRITLDAYEDKPFDSIIKSIDFVSHTTSTGGTAYTVEAGLEEFTYPSRVGMNGNADIIRTERFNVITIPLSSIFNNEYVYVKTKDGIQQKKVVLGIQNDTDVEVVRGLSTGDVVLAQPSQAPKKSSGFLNFHFQEAEKHTQ